MGYGTQDQPSCPKARSVHIFICYLVPRTPSSVHVLMFMSYGAAWCRASRNSSSLEPLSTCDDLIPTGDYASA